METKPKVEHLTGSLQKCSQINLVQTGNNKYEISVYNDNLTPKGILNQVSKLKKAFPSLDLGFYDLLTDRIKESNFTDKRFEDSVNNVIDTCKYPKPSISDFVRFDKTVKLRNYDYMCKLALDWGHKVWNRYDKIKINGRVYWYDRNEIHLPN